MNNTIVYSSESDNCYLYDYQHSLSMLIHPDIMKIHNNADNPDIDPYYKKKYYYLKENGFFSQKKASNFLTELSGSIIKNNIIQAKQIVFEVTDSCNLRCTYCILGDCYEGFKSEKTKEINQESAVKLLTHIINLKIQHDSPQLTISFYGGEPLLNMGFIKSIVEIIEGLNSGHKLNIVFSLTTNATLLYKNIQYLKDKDFKLMISLDGDSQNSSYRIFRKNSQGSFQEVIQNIDRIKENYPDFFLNNISFNAVLHKRNSVKDIYNFIYNRYHKIPNISELSIDNISPQNEQFFKSIFKSKRESENEYEDSSSKLSEITHNQSTKFYELVDYIKYYSINSYVSDIPSLLNNTKKHFPTNTCIPFSKKIYLTTRNKILPCEKINHKFALGEVNNDINVNYDEIANSFNVVYKRLANLCQYCYVSRFCGVCMFNIKDLDFSNTYKFSCETFHDEKKMQYKLKNIFSFIERNPKDLYEVVENITITV